MTQKSTKAAQATLSGNSSDVACQGQSGGGRRQHLFEVGGFLVIGHVKDLGFQDAAEGNDRLATMLLHPLEDLQQGMQTVC